MQRYFTFIQGIAQVVLNDNNPLNNNVEAAISLTTNDDITSGISQNKVYIFYVFIITVIYIPFTHFRRHRNTKESPR